MTLILITTLKSLSDSSDNENGTSVKTDYRTKRTQNEHSLKANLDKTIFYKWGKNMNTLNNFVQISPIKDKANTNMT